MKTKLSRSLLIAATLLVASVTGLWVSTGAHRGWSQTSKVVMHHDEITDIDYPVREKAFVAGVEIVALGAGTGLLLAAASMVAHRRRRAHA